MLEDSFRVDSFRAHKPSLSIVMVQNVCPPTSGTSALARVKKKANKLGPRVRS